MSTSATATDASDELKEWSSGLMRKLYKERPRFCDTSIKCIDDTLYAHRAVLAARTQCVFSSQQRACLACEVC